MIYEPSMAEGETREAYLERFRRVNRPAWTFLSDEEWAQIDHHVTTCDCRLTGVARFKAQSSRRDPRSASAGIF